MHNSVAVMEKKAGDMGASDVRIISPGTLPVDDGVPDMCREPLCPCYGKCALCPPHAMKPQEFRSLVASFGKALLFRRTVPAQELMGASAVHFQQLQVMASALETQARELGMSQAQGYAAGSCLAALCPGLECAALEQGGTCRHPKTARSSLEAVGIHVFQLLEKVGWDITKITSQSAPEEGETGSLVGLVLLE